MGAGVHRYGTALLAVVAGMGASIVLQPNVEQSALMLVLVVPLVVVGYFAGAGPTVSAALLNAILADLLFFEPRYSLVIINPQERILVLLFLAVAAVVASLARIIDRLHVRALRERASEQRFRGTFENAAVGMTHTDPSGRFIMVNQTFQNLVGYSAEELIGRTIWSITLPEDIAEDQRQYRRMFSGEITSYSRDKGYRHKNGHAVWVSLSSSIQPAEPGGEPYAINVAQDVSDRRAAEQALQAAHDKVLDILNSITDGLVLLDRSYNIVDANSAAQRILETDRQLEGRSLWEFFPVVRAGRFREEFGKALETGLATSFEEFYPPMQTWFEVRVYPTRDGLAVYFHDIGDRRRDQESLRQATREARERALEAEEGRRVLQAMLEHVPMGLIVADSSGGIRFASQVAKDWMKAGNNGGISQTLLAYHPGSSQPAESSQLPLARAIARGEVVHGEEWELRRPDGTSATVLANAAPIRNEYGDIIGGVVGWQDITPMKIAQKAAAEASRAKDHFLAVLSHELRTPLTPVIAAAGMLQEDPRLPEDARQDMQMIRRNVELEKRLIDDLLDLTRISRGKLEMHFRPVDVGTVLRRAVEVCVPEINAKGLHLVLDLPETPQMVMADEARLQQVFWNLIHNAMKFTNSGGSITVRCAADSSGKISAEVSDTGVGIDPRAISRIFEAFEQQDRAVTRQFGGLGLGLAICKAIVTQHEGEIRARSGGRNMGATFTVALPRLQAVPIGRKQTAKPTQEAAPSDRKLHILLVEDHADTARILSRLLKREGYEVDVAFDMETALATAEKSKFDLLVSDLGLPDGSGLELMRRLRQRDRTIRGIAISGYGQQKDIEQSSEAGFIEHVTKPVDIDQLTAAVARSVAR